MRPTIAFFNNKGGVGKTTMVYHIGWALAELGYNTLCVDLDPQANLTSAFIDEASLEAMWIADAAAPRTVFHAVAPLMDVGDIREIEPYMINDRLSIVPGDLSLASFEGMLSQEWANALGQNTRRAMRIESSFWVIAQRAALLSKADLILLDIGPNLGAINRAALIASDYIVVPLAPDLFSLRGLSNIGPSLKLWRREWQDRLARQREDTSASSKPDPDQYPRGTMQPLGYVVLQHNVRLDRPVAAYGRWTNQIPREFVKSLVDVAGEAGAELSNSYELGRVKHFRSLMAMAQEVRKPVFKLTAADGAIGGHASAAKASWEDFKVLAENIVAAMKRQQAASGQTSLRDDRAT